MFQKPNYKGADQPVQMHSTAGFFCLKAHVICTIISGTGSNIFVSKCRLLQITDGAVMVVTKCPTFTILTVTSSQIYVQHIYS